MCVCLYVCMCKCFVFVHVYGYVCVTLVPATTALHREKGWGKRGTQGLHRAKVVAHRHALGHASRTGGSCDPPSGLQPVQTSTWACLHQSGMIVTEAFSPHETVPAPQPQQALCREDNAPEALHPNSLDASNLGGLDLKVEDYTHSCLHRHLTSGEGLYSGTLS